MTTTIPAKQAEELVPTEVGRDGEFRLASSIEDSSGPGVLVYVRTPDPLCVPPAVAEAARQATSKLMVVIDRDRAERDPEVKKSAQRTVRELLQCFDEADLPAVYHEVSPNEYWPEAYPHEILSSPWIVATTRIGHIKIGWRKRVVTIDWSRTRVKRDGVFLFTSLTSNTIGETYVHANNYVEVVKFLKVLAREGRPGT